MSNNIEPLKYGYGVENSVGSEPYLSAMVSKIVDVTPVRWDGVLEDYIVCAQDRATHMVIREIDDDGELNHIYIPIGCENLFMLADLL
jgi:hypothetical protein